LPSLEGFTGIEYDDEINKAGVKKCGNEKVNVIMFPFLASLLINHPYKSTEH
jgi:hypothetical protein